MVHEIYERVLKLHHMNYSRQFLLEALSVAKRLPPHDELRTVYSFQPRTCGLDISITSALRYAITNTNQLENQLCYYVLRLIQQVVPDYLRKLHVCTSKSLSCNGAL
jgi:hypothetical protein